MAALSALFVTGAHAQFTVGAGVTDNAAKTIASGQAGTVKAAGTLSVGSGTAAVTVGTGTTSINNSGTIEQTGTGRAIDSNSGTPVFTLVNAAGASLTAAGAEVIRINRSGGAYTIDNQGTIWMTGTAPGGSRAIKADAAFTLAGSITNGSELNRSALIRSDANDAIRLGSNITLVNWGTIDSRSVVNTSCPDYQAASVGCANDFSAADGVAIENGRGNTVILNHGVISGPRHGVDGGDPVSATADPNLLGIDRLVLTSATTAGATFDVVRGGATTGGVRIVNPVVVNEAGGTITGHNGSGVGIDGHAVVINHGTITGSYAGAGRVFDHEGAGLTVNNGDGDGVDIDGIAYVENWGRIQGLGAGGLDSGGNPNGADGIAAGGGTLINHAGATIQGQSKGILVDDGANGTAIGAQRGTATAHGGAVRIVNDGTIVGERGTAIGLVGDFADTLDNGASGVIVGGAQSVRVDENASTTAAAAVQMGAGADTLINNGRIEGRNGLAIDMGAGDDLTQLLSGGSTGVIVGTIDGGAGTDTLETGGTHRFAAGQVVRFERFVVRSGMTTFEGALGAVGTVQVDAGAALRIDGAFSTSGALTVDGRLAAPTGTTPRTVDAASYSQGATGVLEARVGAAGASDRIVVAGTATLADGATLAITPIGYVADGSTYTLLSAGTLTAAASNLQLQGDSALVRYELATVGQELRLVAERTATIAAVAPAGLGGLGAALDALGGSGAGASALLGRIDAQSTTAGVADALRQLSPESNGASQQATNAAAAAVFSALNDRMDAARNGALARAGGVGLAAGDAMTRRGWVQGLGAWGEQKARAGANGFDLDAWGVAAGIESDRSASDITGLSVSLSHAAADGQGAGFGDDVRVRSASLAGYFSRTLPDMTMDASALLGRNRYDSRRAVVVGGVTESLAGGYNGWQIAGQVEAGFPFTMRPDLTGRWLVGARASYLATDGYDEQGGGAALRVGSAHSTSFQSVLGAELNWATGSRSAVQMRARWLHEFADAPDLDASFVAGSPSFTTAGVARNRDSLQLGVGLRHEAARGVTLNLRYDAEVKSGYVGHQLSARAVWTF